MLAQICLDDLKKDPVIVMQFSQMSQKLTHALVHKQVKRKLSKFGLKYRRAAEQGLDVLAHREHDTKAQGRRTTRRNTVGHIHLTYP